MTNTKPIVERIKDGIIYFEGIEPSKWNAATTLHAKMFMRMVGEYIDGKEARDNFEVAKELFK